MRFAEPQRPARVAPKNRFPKAAFPPRRRKFQRIPQRLVNKYSASPGIGEQFIYGLPDHGVGFFGALSTLQQPAHFVQKCDLHGSEFQFAHPMTHGGRVLFGHH